MSTLVVVVVVVVVVLLLLLLLLLIIMLLQSSLSMGCYSVCAVNQTFTYDLTDLFVPPAHSIPSLGMHLAWA